MRNNSLVFVVPGSFQTRTGGYEYDRRIVAGLRALGWSVDICEVDGSFPRPTTNALHEAARVLAALPDRTTVMIDGLALGAMPDQVECESSRLRIVALVHLPLAAEIGLDSEAAARAAAGEKRALRASARIVVTGRSVRDSLAVYGIRDEQIAVVEPGTDRVALARGSEDGSLQLLCVATLNRGKGHAILFRALRSIDNGRWRLTCAGSLDRDPPTVERLRQQLRSDGLADRVTLAGDVGSADLSSLYDRADLFVLPTLYETYGMAVAEALAHGIPIVSTRTGAIPDLVGESAGILVGPGDEKAFADALAAIMSDGRLRQRLAEGARLARERLPAWDDAAANMGGVLSAIS